MPDSAYSLKFDSGTLICKDVEIRGDVTIGVGTIVHPRARIIAEAGPIIIGDNNLIEDRAIIWNKLDSKSGSTPVMIIGNYNVFEVDSQCMALKVGDNNVVEMKAVVDREVVLTDGCVVGAACVLRCTETLPRNTAVYGSNCQRRLTQCHQSQALQIDVLTQNLLRHHKDFKKPTI